MNSFDLILKNMILSAPNLYPTVWQCYVAIFIDPNTEFTFNNSAIQCPFEVKSAPIISGRYLELYKTLAVNEVGELDYEMKTFMHNFINENIDMIVSTKTVYVEYLEPSSDDLELLSDLSPVWLIDATYPADILAAAVDVLSKMKHLLWRHHGIHHSLTRPIERDSWYELCYHEAYVKVSDRIEQFKPQRISV